MGEQAIGLGFGTAGLGHHGFQVKTHFVVAEFNL
jgi:hypothetical protein